MTVNVVNLSGLCLLIHTVNFTTQNTLLLNLGGVIDDSLRGKLVTLTECQCAMTVNKFKNFRLVPTAPRRDNLFFNILMAVNDVDWSTDYHNSDSQWN